MHALFCLAIIILKWPVFIQNFYGLISMMASETIKCFYLGQYKFREWPVAWWHKAITLSHWGRVMHICLIKLTSIGSDNALLPGRCQAIIWTNAGILLIGPLGTNFSEILIEIYTFSLKKMHLKMSSGKWRPSCLSLNELDDIDRR